MCIGKQSTNGLREKLHLSGCKKGESADMGSEYGGGQMEIYKTTKVEETAEDDIGRG